MKEKPSGVTKTLLATELSVRLQIGVLKLTGVNGQVPDLMVTGQQAGITMLSINEKRPTITDGIKTIRKHGAYLLGAKPMQPLTEKTHWQKPGQTMTVQVNNYQDYPGSKIILSDYVDINYIQLINNYGGVAKNYATNYGGSAVAESLSDVTMSHRYTGRSADSQWMYSQFDITITGGDLDYRIETYAQSANGKAVGYSDSTESIKIDGTLPTGGWSTPSHRKRLVKSRCHLDLQPIRCTKRG